MIVDGGLGTELARRGFCFSTGLWSGEAILNRPELLVAIHRAYLAAGADVIETATYQLSHAALRGLGYDDAAIDTIFERGIGLARDAIAAHKAQTGTRTAFVVAASLGPFGATVGDGSEYCGTQHLERDALHAFHVERSRCVARAKPDVLLFETIPSRAEALVIAEVARDLGFGRVWLSLSCSDGAYTCAGDRVSEIAAALDAFACIEVIGINCTAPDAIGPLVRALKSASAKPIMVCPNLGGHGENERRASAGGALEAEFLRRVPEWLDLGVAHVGGCCGVGPDTIGAVAAVVADVRRERGESRNATGYLMRTFAP